MEEGLARSVSFALQEIVCCLTQYFVQSGNRIEIKKYIPCVQITLSLDALNISDPGYQPPLDESEVEPYDDEIAAGERK